MSERKWDLAKMEFNKLSPFDSMTEVFEKLADGGGLGIQECLLQMLEGNRNAELFVLDNLKLYGGAIYRLWNDCCGRDQEKMSEVLYLCHTRKLSALYIHRHVGEARGVPIKTFSEWVKSSKSIGTFYTPGDMVGEDVVTFCKELGTEAVIIRESMFQLRGSQHAHKDEAGKVTALYSTFQNQNGVWIFLGECPKLPNNFCDICPCKGCDRSLHDGGKDDCHSCDICIDGDISCLHYPVCRTGKRPASLVMPMEPCPVPNFYYKGKFVVSPIEN